MPINPADGPILGTLYGSDAMRAVFDESTYFQRMLDVEAALAQVQARLGVIPADAANSPRPAGLPAWDSLSADQKKLYARFMEVYGGVIAYQDVTLPMETGPPVKKRVATMAITEDEDAARRNRRGQNADGEMQPAHCCDSAAISAARLASSTLNSSSV